MITCGFSNPCQKGKVYKVVGGEEKKAMVVASDEIETDIKEKEEGFWKMKQRIKGVLFLLVVVIENVKEGVVWCVCEN